MCPSDGHEPPSPGPIAITAKSELVDPLLSVPLTILGNSVHVGMRRDEPTHTLHEVAALTVAH